jgi:hypothetical protein
MTDLATGETAILADWRMQALLDRDYAGPDNPATHPKGE